MNPFAFRLNFKPVVGAWVICCTASLAWGANNIEADPDKSYELSKNRGPWLIMAATFTTNAEGNNHQGKTPREAADELVLELRRLGMPAYTYEYTPGVERLTVQDASGREERRRNQTRYTSVCVLAGNYPDINDKTAQQSLKWIKKLRPKSMQDGVVFIPTPGRPTPMSGAFLTINPLLSPEEIEANRSLDPHLIVMNNGERYSLFENAGEYSLVIARFYGKQATVKNISALEGFLKDNDLDNAAISARELVTVLRGKYDQNGIYNNVDAYVWHDKTESIVTVGSFSGPNDPAVARYMEQFGPKAQDLPNGSSAVQPQGFGVRNFGRKRDETRLWIFEPAPQLVKVPRVK
ncbi:MAG: hypothetical protein KDA80_02700 [Planctomycetaceae bacterium]|nr:hypothetical protein [Planctomycetaceae bacterium]